MAMKTAASVSAAFLVSLCIQYDIGFGWYEARVLSTIIHR